MPIPALRRVPVLFFLAGFVLFAQDAAMVLRTSVSYGTQRASLKLTDDQRSQVDDLARQAREATQAQKYGDALRFYYHGTAVMRNTPWTPALEFAASLEGRLDHAMLEPGKKVTATLKPLYSSPAGETKFTVSVFLGEQSLASDLAIDPA